MDEKDIYIAFLSGLYWLSWNNGIRMCIVYYTCFLYTCVHFLASVNWNAIAWCNLFSCCGKFSSKVVLQFLNQSLKKDAIYTFFVTTF